MTSHPSEFPPDPWAIERTAVSLTPFRLATLLVRRWRVVLGVPLVSAVFAVAFTLAFREYVASARFIPQTSGGDMARLSGLAAQFGMPIGGGGSAETPDFYVALVTSGEVLSQVAATSFEVLPRPESPDTVSGPLLDLLDIEGDTPEERLRSGVDALKGRVSASASVKSGIVTLSVVTDVPGLSEAVVRRILDVTSDFDQQRRQQQARTERTFVADRLASSEGELRAAENALTAFLERNRRPHQSALLTMEMERLQRHVSLRQQVHATLAQAYEQARVEEVRNTPVLTVVDRPEGSARSKRGPLMAAVLGGGFGAAAVLALLLTGEYLGRHAGSPDFEELRRALGLRRTEEPPTGDTSLGRAGTTQESGAWAASREVAL